MARTFEIIRHGAYRWVEVTGGKVRRGDLVRVKDSGAVVSALLPAVNGDPQTYIAFGDGTTSVVNGPDPGSTDTGVTVHHPDGGLVVIPLATP